MSAPEGFPKVHPRQKIMADARFVIQRAVGDSIEKFALTPHELISILADEIVAWNGFALRDERDKST